MTNLHAAIGLAQVEKLPVIKRSRRDAFLYYKESLHNLSFLLTPNLNEKDLEKILSFIFYLRVLDNKRDYFILYMKSKGIDTGIHWQAGHNFTIFNSCEKDDLSCNNKIVSEIVSAPFHSQMSKSDQDLVIESIKGFKNEI